MEWVETTAKTVDAAKEAALDRLGVAADEAEFDVVDEPKQGLFGRTRGEARVRARVKPTPVRAKNERRRRSTKDQTAAKPSSSRDAGDSTQHDDSRDDETSSESDAPAPKPEKKNNRSRNGSTRNGSTRNGNRSNDNKQEKSMSNDRESSQSDVTPQEVGDAAVAFMNGLVEAFDATGSTALEIDGTELDVAVTGEELGLLVGPGGRTLDAIQDLLRVSAQRRLGDHETRLRVDVAGYRVRRNEALSRFAADVAGQVRESGSPRSLEPMRSADRKVIHDALNEEDGVESRSEGDDPNRRVVVIPV